MSINHICTTNKLNFINNYVLVTFWFDQSLHSAEYFRAPCFRETKFAHFINVRALSLLLSRPVHLLGFATIALLVLREKKQTTARNKKLLVHRVPNWTIAPLPCLSILLLQIRPTTKSGQPVFLVALAPLEVSTWLTRYNYLWLCWHFLPFWSSCPYFLTFKFIEFKTF